MSYQQSPQQQQPPQQQQQQPQYGHPHQQQQQQYAYLPAYQPPQPVPHQYQQHPQPTQPVHVSPTGMWASKLTLRLISMIFSIVIIGLGASVYSDLNKVSRYTRSYSRLYSDYDSDYEDGFLFQGPILFLGPPAAVAFVWSLAEAICICARGGHRGIHPGACVGVDLIIWLGFVGSATGVALAFYWIFSPYVTYQYPLITFVFGIIEAAIHFTLFVIACCETNIRNRRSTLVYVQPGPVHGNGNMPPTGATPMATSYSTKEQTTTVTQPAVARKPLGLSPDTHSQWDQHNPLTADGFRTPETNNPPFQPPATPEMPATYRPNERY